MKVLKLMFGQDLGTKVWFMFAVIIWFKTFEIEILKLCNSNNWKNIQFIFIFRILLVISLQNNLKSRRWDVVISQVSLLFSFWQFIFKLETWEGNIFCQIFVSFWMINGDCLHLVQITCMKRTLNGDVSKLWKWLVSFVFRFPKSSRAYNSIKFDGELQRWSRNC